jgi:hypothetical protein
MSTITIPPKVESPKVQETRKENPNILQKGVNGLGDASKKCPNPKDSDCICSECIQDKQYLIWALEA